MIDDLRVRYRSVHTIKAYVACIANFAQHFRKSPETLGPQEIRQHQYLVNERRVSLSYLIQLVCALCLLYYVTLDVRVGPWGRGGYASWVYFDIPYAGTNTHPLLDTATD
jgi:hypothetical protein